MIREDGMEESRLLEEKQMIDGQNPDAVSLKEMAEYLGKIYDDFIASVRALGAKKKDGKRSTKMGSSMAHWIGGGHVTTDREGLCEKFLADVQAHLELFQMALECAGKEEAAEAAAIAVDIMMEPCPPKSDSTTDLMRRAMIGQAKPLLPYLTPEKRQEKLELLKKSYSRWHRLPVEQEMIRELEAVAK